VNYICTLTHTVIRACRQQTNAKNQTEKTRTNLRVVSKHAPESQKNIKTLRKQLPPCSTVHSISFNHGTTNVTCQSNQRAWDVLRTQTEPSKSEFCSITKSQNHLSAGGSSYQAYSPMRHTSKQHFPTSIVGSRSRKNAWHSFASVSPAHAREHKIMTT
jgi:hypothetical protein